MAEFSSNAKGNTGVALGGTALGLGVLNTIGGGLMGLLGGNWGNNCNNGYNWGYNNNGCCNNNRPVDQYELAYAIQDSRRGAEIYSDKNLEKAGVALLREVRDSDAKIAAVLKDVTDAEIRIGTALATTQAEIKCINEKAALKEELYNEKLKNANERIYNLQNEMQRGLEFEARERVQGIQTLKDYCDCNFYKMKKVVALDDICPPAMPQFNSFELPKAPAK